MKPSEFDPGNSSGRPLGIGIVAGVHVVIGWALASGLGNEMVAAIKKPLEAVVLQEVTLPPPPPPPPPKPVEQPKQIVQQTPVPPPPFVPPAEVMAAPNIEAPVLQSSPTPPTEPAPIAPPPPPAPPAATGKVDLAVACPTQVRPEIPAKALRDGVSGTVRAQATILGGAVASVEILGGPRVFHAVVREAMQKYRCTAPDGTVAVQTFDFRVE